MRRSGTSVASPQSIRPAATARCGFSVALIYLRTSIRGHLDARYAS